MVPNPRRCTRGARLDDDQIEPEREVRQGLTVGEDAAIKQAKRCGSHPCSFAMVDSLLRQSEIAPDPPSDLHHDQRGRWTGIDRHDIELMSTYVDVPGEFGPTD
jgi:hypothetical protein